MAAANLFVLFAHRIAPDNKRSESMWIARRYGIPKSVCQWESYEGVGRVRVSSNSIFVMDSDPLGVIPQGRVFQILSIPSINPVYEASKRYHWACIWRIRFARDKSLMRFRIYRYWYHRFVTGGSSINYCVRRVGGVLPLGFQISVSSSSSVFVKQFINQTWIMRYGSYVPQNTLMLLWSSAVSVYSIGGLLGSLLCGFLTGKYGKTKCQRFVNCMGITASLILGFSKMATSYEMIVIGRFFYGITTGMGLNIYMQYLGEISPGSIRGFINTTAAIFATSGKLWGQIVGLSEVLGTEKLWPLMLSVTGFTYLLQLVVMPFYPETPADLLLAKRDKEQCLQAMKKLWGDGDYQAEIDDLIAEQETCKNRRNMSVLEVVREPSMRWQLYVLVCCILTLQLCGINAIYYYATSVFLTAGLPTAQIPYISLGMGSCEILAVILCSLLIEHYGRKVLLLGSYAFMAGMLAFLTVSLSLQGWYDWIPYCSAVFIFLFIFFFGMGPGTITLVMLIEICKHSSRAAVFVIFSSLNWFGLYVIGLAFPYVVAGLGHFCVLIFLVCIVASGIFLLIFLPETKGKSIAQITEEFNKLNYRGKLVQESEEVPTKESLEDTSF
ncbi:solute carrier family 2, facilitated glucose transporter member 11 [Bombina bombina]|uniref:solute carrier family 2, facilitated glucose transporter member 11 n=1 Tax=Bombina bombina TaxID=8345 RepID=UPI00235ACFC9|nr:solute carrier family 2, facilitated glucose transporter member 11 [Bombina bombina]